MMNFSYVFYVSLQNYWLFVSIWREFGDGGKFDGEGNVFGHTYYPGNGLGGDVFFDPDENWLLYPYSEDGNQLHKKILKKVNLLSNLFNEIFS